MNSLRGFRILGKGPVMMPLSNNTIGLMFITRPQLNLTDDNIKRSERLISLYGVSPNSIGAYIRSMLDERYGNSIYCPFINNKLPWITCLTEYLKISTGFSDLQAKIDTSEPGLREQVYQRVASKIEENGQYTMTQTYNNPAPGVIPELFRIWGDYYSEVRSGDRQCYPRDKYLMGNRIDYDCRIYHLIMNKDTEYLEHIFATIQSIPSTYPAGSIANIDNTSNSLRGEGQDDFSIQFSSVGMRFNEWGLIQSFNEHQYMYNPALKPGSRESNYRELKTEEYIAYGYAAYPLLLPKINEDKSLGSVNNKRTGIKMTWWVEKNFDTSINNIVL
jgi:hypothetical protein